VKKKLIIITTVPISLSFFKGQIQVLKKKFDVEVLSSFGENLEKICREEDVIGHSIEMKREISLFNDIQSLFALIRFFLIQKPYLIHGSTPKAGLLSMIAAWVTRIPVRIYYIHGLRYHGSKGLKRRILILMEKISCFFATDVFSVSTGVKSVLKEDEITKKEINIIWNGSVNGIDSSCFFSDPSSIKLLKKKYNISDEDFVYGFVGRLVTDKGINELVKAFLKVNAIYSNTKLLLVGNFEDALDPLERKVKNEIETNTSIIYTGYQLDIRSFFNIMDIFVFPSYREGFGISLMEAAAMGVPAISSNIIGCNEIIKDNYNGVLIAPKSVNCLQEAMVSLLESKDTLKNMANVSRQYVIDKYEQVELWSKTLIAYSKLVEKK
jgi:glycosyltransferase involved in cell wall biosynthesis